MNPETQIAQHAKLIGVLTLIAQAEEKLKISKEHYLKHKWMYSWESAVREMHEQEITAKAAARLRAYYAKQLFKMCSTEYNSRVKYEPNLVNN